MKILIVDDEAKLREVIAEYAHFEGYETDEAGDGREAIDKCRENNYDLIIMDIMMPKIDGFTAVKEIRKFSDTPVIMLSARTEETDKLYGFGLGVDDYVVKPFSTKEVMARINAILSRRKSQKTEEKPSDEMKFEGLEIDFKGRTVKIDGKAADLTPKEYELLFYMVKNRGVALTREKLLADVWGYDFFGDDRTVDTHIKTLRSNLGEYRKFILTLRGLGYKFEA
ncbi:MAG TPA: DNA-binding response regulator [Clostridiales bacterium]|nr:DNA-binding response regulator [Clostridiales bacterium]